VKILGHGGADILPSTKFSYNNNPPYAANKFDEWGFYKSDYPESTNVPGSGSFYYDESSEPITNSRKITEISADHTDAWSLSSITTALGSKIAIEYEPNDYAQSVYNDYNAFGIENIERVSIDRVKVSFKEKGISLDRYFSIAQMINIKAFITSVYTAVLQFRSVPDFYIESNTISEVHDDYIIVNSPSLNELLRVGRTITIESQNRSLYPYFISGVVSGPDMASTKFAGGIRVKSISVTQINGVDVTMYEYKNPATSASSGVTSYKPFNVVGVHYPTDVEVFNDFLSKDEYKQERVLLIRHKTKFQKYLNQLNEKVYMHGREAPAPGVIYEFVSVKNKYNSQILDNYTVNQFEVFKEPMISREKTEFGTPAQQRAMVTIQNNSIGVGNLKKVMLYSSSGNSMLHERQYGYLSDDQTTDFESPILAQGQGIVEQSFHKYIAVKDYINHGYVQNEGYTNIETVSSSEKAIVTKRKDFSNALTSIEEINYKTANTSATQYQAFDFFSGQPLKVVTNDSYGNSYVSETLPAYSLVQNGNAVYPSMGLKLRNPFNKHMITQEAATYVYKINGSGIPIGFVSAAIQTWSDQIPSLEPGEFLSQANAQSGIWRKHASFSFIGDNTPTQGDGLFPLVNNTLPVFSAWHINSPVPEKWQKNNEITLYNVHSHALEAKDLNEQYAATKMSFDQSRVIATVTNAEYREFGYSNAEERPAGDLFGHDVVQNSTVYAPVAHTGAKALSVEPGARAFTFYMAPKQRTYHVSVWSSQPTCAFKYKFDFNSQANTATLKNSGRAGNWYLLEADIPVTESWDGIEIWCEANGATTYFDDFRVHPMDASMTSYVYNEWGELSHILDNNNLYTKFEYDGMGRLKSTYKETFSHGTVRTNEHKYHYARQQD
jgi:hypothetical protein